MTKPRGKRPNRRARDAAIAAAALQPAPEQRTPQAGTELVVEPRPKQDGGVVVTPKHVVDRRVAFVQTLLADGFNAPSILRIVTQEAEKEERLRADAKAAGADDADIELFAPRIWSGKPWPRRTVVWYIEKARRATAKDGMVFTQQRAFMFSQNVGRLEQIYQRASAEKKLQVALNVVRELNELFGLKDAMAFLLAKEGAQLFGLEPQRILQGMNAPAAAVDAAGEQVDAMLATPASARRAALDALQRTVLPFLSVIAAGPSTPMAARLKAADIIARVSAASAAPTRGMILPVEGGEAEAPASASAYDLSILSDAELEEMERITAKLERRALAPIPEPAPVSISSIAPVDESSTFARSNGHGPPENGEHG